MSQFKLPICYSFSTLFRISSFGFPFLALDAALFAHFLTPLTWHLVTFSHALRP